MEAAAPDTLRSLKPGDMDLLELEEEVDYEDDPYSQPRRPSPQPEETAARSMLDDKQFYRSATLSAKDRSRSGAMEGSKREGEANGHREPISWQAWKAPERRGGGNDRIEQSRPRSRERSRERMLPPDLHRLAPRGRPRSPDHMYSSYRRYPPLEEIRRTRSGHSLLPHYMSFVDDDYPHRSFPRSYSRGYSPPLFPRLPPPSYLRAPRRVLDDLPRRAREPLFRPNEPPPDPRALEEWERLRNLEMKLRRKEIELLELEASKRRHQVHTSSPNHAGYFDERQPRNMYAEPKRDYDRRFSPPDRRDSREIQIQFSPARQREVPTLLGQVDSVRKAKLEKDSRTSPKRAPKRRADRASPRDTAMKEDRHRKQERETKASEPDNAALAGSERSTEEAKAARKAAPKESVGQLKPKAVPSTSIAEEKSKSSSRPNQSKPVAEKLRKEPAQSLKRKAEDTPAVASNRRSPGDKLADKARTSGAAAKLPSRSMPKVEKPSSERRAEKKPDAAAKVENADGLGTVKGEKKLEQRAGEQKSAPKAGPAANNKSNDSKDKGTAIKAVKSSNGKMKSASSAQQADAVAMVTTKPKAASKPDAAKGSSKPAPVLASSIAASKIRSSEHRDGTGEPAGPSGHPAATTATRGLRPVAPPPPPPRLHRAPASGTKANGLGQLLMPPGPELPMPPELPIPRMLSHDGGFPSKTAGRSVPQLRSGIMVGSRQPQRMRPLSPGQPKHRLNGLRRSSPGGVADPQLPLETRVRGRGGTRAHVHPDDEAHAEYYYLDPKGAIQGPASKYQLRKWLTQLANANDTRRHQAFCNVNVWREGMHPTDGTPLLRLLGGK